MNAELLWLKCVLCVTRERYPTRKLQNTFMVAELRYEPRVEPSSLASQMAAASSADDQTTAMAVVTPASPGGASWQGMAATTPDAAARLDLWAAQVDAQLAQLFSAMEGIVTSGSAQVNSIANAVVSTATHSQQVQMEVQQAVTALSAGLLQQRQETVEEFATQRAALERTVAEAGAAFTSHEKAQNESKAKLDALLHVAQVFGSDVERHRLQAQSLEQQLASLTSADKGKGYSKAAPMSAGSGAAPPYEARQQRQHPGAAPSMESPPGFHSQPRQPSSQQPPQWQDPWWNPQQPQQQQGQGFRAQATSPTFATSADEFWQGQREGGYLDANDGGRPIDYSRLFEDKVALTSTYAYAGGHNVDGESWRKTTRGYWMSRYPAVICLLDWAERREEKEITMQDLTTAAMNGQFIGMEGSTPTRLSQCIWGFLNHCVTGDARAMFDGADVLNGLDAWRRIIHHIRKNRWVRREQLRKLIKHIPKIAKLEDIESTIITYDNNVKLYQEASEKIVDPVDKKSDLMEALPTEIREQLQWRMSVAETYEDFRNHLIATANNMLFQRGKLPSPVHAVDEQATHEGSDMDEAIIAALGRMGFRKGGGKGRQANGESPSPTGHQKTEGAASARKCINCGSTQHSTRECTKAQLPKEQRPCWRCGKPGHLGAQCPNKALPPKPAKLVDDDNEGDFFGCVVQASKKSNSWPTPSKVTLWDHVQKSMHQKEKHRSQFEALMTDEGEEAHDHQGEVTNHGGYESPVQSAGAILKARKMRKRRSEKEPLNVAAGSIAATTWPNDVPMPHEATDDCPVTCQPCGAHGHQMMTGQPCCTIDWTDIHHEDSEDESSAEINVAEEVVEVPVALDSGSVEHVANAQHLPASTPVIKRPDHRNFVAANGGEIIKYGEADVDMEQANGSTVALSFHVADVTRPLHSTGRICDSASRSCPSGHEIIYTRDEAVVAPAGALSQFISQTRRIATYKRARNSQGKGGLYVASMKMKTKQPASGFTRQGQKS